MVILRFQTFPVQLLYLLLKSFDLLRMQKFHLQNAVSWLLFLSGFASVPRPQHAHWDHGHECVATFLNTETEFASHNWKFYEDNR